VYCCHWRWFFRRFGALRGAARKIIDDGMQQSGLIAPWPRQNRFQYSVIIKIFPHMNLQVRDLSDRVIGQPGAAEFYREAPEDPTQ